MRLPRVRFPIWRLMAVIAIVACAAGAFVCFSTDENVQTGSAALHGVPAMLA